MASENAKAVARDVSENLRKNKKVILGRIIKKRGYAKTTSEKPKIVTGTISYQEEIKPILEQMEKERQRVMLAMRERNLTEVQYGELNRTLDTLTKNIQLLSGGATDRTENLFTNEQINTIAERISSGKGGNGDL